MAGRRPRRAKSVANSKLKLKKPLTEASASKPSSDCPLPTSSGQLTEASDQEPLSDCPLPTSSGQQGLNKSSGDKPSAHSPLPTLSGQDVPVTKSILPVVCLPSSSSGQGLGRPTGFGYRPDLYHKTLVSYGSSDSSESDQSAANHSKKQSVLEEKDPSFVKQWSKMFPINKQTDSTLPSNTPISPKPQRCSPAVYSKANLKSSSTYRQTLFAQGAQGQDLPGDGGVSPSVSLNESLSDHLRDEAPKAKENLSSSGDTVSSTDRSDSSFIYVAKDSNNSDESSNGFEVVQKSRKKKKQRLETLFQVHRGKSSLPNKSDHFEEFSRNQDRSKIKRGFLSSDSALTRKVKENQKIEKHSKLNSRAQSPFPNPAGDIPFLSSNQGYSDAPSTRTDPVFHKKSLSKPNSQRASVKSKAHLDERGGRRGGTSQESSSSRTPFNSKGHSFSEPEQLDDLEDSSKNRYRPKDKRVFLSSDSALPRNEKEYQEIRKNINLSHGSESSSSDSDGLLRRPLHHNEVNLTPNSPQGQSASSATRTEPLRKVQQSKSRAPSKSKELDSSERAAFSQTSPDLPKFDVKGILKDKLSNLEKNRGQIVWTNLESGRELTKQQRKTMVRVLVRWLYMSHASSPTSVSSDMKEGLAKSIVTDYPILKCTSLSSENLSPWSHYYNRGANTGWIPNSARHVQRKHRSRKTTKKVVEEEQEGSSEYGSDQIEALGQVLVNLRTKQDIFRGMQACFKTRKVERKRGETIDFFLNKYPHFKHFDGEVIFQEYSLMFSNAQDLQRPFASKLDKILALEPVRRMDLKHDDDILRALILLSHQLPHDIPFPKEKFDYSWAREEDLFVILEPNDNITDYVIERMRNSAKAIQPYSILVQSSIDKKITSSFIVLDSKELEIECPRQRPLLHALSVLMQCYCVFNVLHPFGWRNTLHFVQHYFMNIKEKQYHRSSRGGEYTSASEMELWERLQ